MAINKTINKSTKTHGAMRNCIEYVLREQKITDRLVCMTGPSPEEINQDTVYQSFLAEKRLWNKDSGRMYNHNVISFHKDEKITPEQALEFGIDFAEDWFPNHQTLVAVHQDRAHVHIHLITNTVSYMDGKKLHNSRADLQRMKDFTNQMCMDRGFSITEKGRHFDGSKIEEGEITAWSKDKYNLLINDAKKSYLADCAIAVMQAKENCCSKEDFIHQMEKRGWHTTWTAEKKHITFKNDEGNKVRDSNLSKTFTMQISKEELNSEFERQNELQSTKRKTDRAREKNKELDKYYAEVESAIKGTGTAKEAVGSVETSDEAERQSDEGRKTGRPDEDTTALIRDIRTEISDNRSQSRIVIDAENQSVANEKQSITDAKQRRIEEQQWVDAEKRAERAARKAYANEEPSL